MGIGLGGWGPDPRTIPLPRPGHFSVVHMFLCGRVPGAFQAQVLVRIGWGPDRVWGPVGGGGHGWGRIGGVGAGSGGWGGGGVRAGGGVGRNGYGRPSDNASPREVRVLCLR